MQAEMTSFWEWQQHFSDEEVCLQTIVKLSSGGQKVFVVLTVTIRKVGYYKHAMYLNVQTAIIILPLQQLPCFTIQNCL